MKKKLLLIMMILISTFTVFAGCGSDKPDPPSEDTTFNKLGFESAEKLLNEINSKLTSSGIVFKTFEPNEDVRTEEGYVLYYESESSGHIRLILHKQSDGAEEFAVHYVPDEDAEDADEDFNKVIKAALSIFEDGEDVFKKLQDIKTGGGNGIEYASYESNYEYSLYLDNEEGYSLTVCTLN